MYKPVYINVPTGVLGVFLEVKNLFKPTTVNGQAEFLTVQGDLYTPHNMRILHRVTDPSRRRVYQKLSEAYHGLSD